MRREKRGKEGEGRRGRGVRKEMAKGGGGGGPNSIHLPHQRR